MKTSPRHYCLVAIIAVLSGCATVDFDYPRPAFAKRANDCLNDCLNDYYFASTLNFCPPTDASYIRPPFA